jgi:hypothetical protein
MKQAYQSVNRLFFPELNIDGTVIVHQRPQLHNVSGVPSGLSEIREFGEESLSYKFMFPDFFFVRTKSLPLLNTSSPGESHGMENSPVELKEKLGTEPHYSLISIDPSIRAQGPIPSS